MKTYTLHFIRHGMTTANEEGRYVGHQDLSLSLQGEDELRYLKDNCVYPDPPVVFTSPLKRSACRARTNCVTSRTTASTRTRRSCSRAP